MSIDLSQFIPTFLEESFEGLELMESSLLNLEQGDIDTINAIFRAAHSIKGGAGTFGFNRVTDFTHEVETLLDEMRDGRRSIEQRDVDLLLRSVDCIRLLIEAARDGVECDAPSIQDVHNALAQTLNKEISTNKKVDDVEQDLSTPQMEHHLGKLVLSPIMKCCKPVMMCCILLTRWLNWVLLLRWSNVRIFHRLILFTQKSAICRGRLRCNRVAIKATSKKSLNGWKMNVT